MRRIEVVKSASFENWLTGLKDGPARLRVAARIERLAGGNAGDVQPVSTGVFELRLDFGPGYRVYFMQRGALIIVLLAGGDKRT